jgi:glycolate oxidase
MRAGVLEELRAALGSAGVIADPTRLLAYECDGLALLRQKPAVVLLPRTTDECSRAMRILHRRKIPVVPRGAGTGLSGGATPVAGGVVVGFARMRDVLEVDPSTDLVRACAGRASSTST